MMLCIFVFFRLFYKIDIFPYFSYCNIIWGSNYKTYLQNLFTVQKRAIRLICNLPRYSSSKASFRNLNLLTLENINRPRYQILLFVFRYHHNLLPKSFTIFFQTGIQIHSHYTRFSHYYRSHYARIRTKEFSIHCTAWALALEWSARRTQSPLLISFKYKLKQLLVNN